MGNPLQIKMDKDNDDVDNDLDGSSFSIQMLRILPINSKQLLRIFVSNYFNDFFINVTIHK